MGGRRYFIDKSTGAWTVVRVFLVFLLIFAIVFFLFCLMRYNEIKDEINKNKPYIEQLSDENKQLQYLVDAPLDDAYKIRIAREKLGMCFPDEIVFYTEVD
jgi:cell division protein FtsB